MHLEDPKCLKCEYRSLLDLAVEQIINIVPDSAVLFTESPLQYKNLVVVTQPLPRHGGMAEDHGAPEAGQLRRVCTRGRRETESRQRASGANSP